MATKWYQAIKQADDIQKPARDVFGHNHGCVLILRESPSFDVPVLDCSDDVALVCRAELDLNLVSPVRLNLLKEQV